MFITSKIIFSSLYFSIKNEVSDGNAEISRTIDIAPAENLVDTTDELERNVILISSDDSSDVEINDPDHVGTAPADHMDMTEYDRDVSEKGCIYIIKKRESSCSSDDSENEHEQQIHTDQ